VPRPALVRMLSASDAAVVVIAAPAGYGKSALVAEWSSVDPRPFACVSVDAAHNDPGALLRYIGAACAEVAPIDAGVLDMVAEATTQPWPEGSAILGDAVSRIDQPVVLVLDGAGDLVSSGSVAVLEQLVDHLGPGSVMVVSGREPSALPLPRLRLERRLLELGPGELAFGAADARSLLGEHGVRLADEDFERLHALTEGWPAGLVMAAMSLRRAGQRRVLPPGAGIRGDDRLLVDYVRAEVLSHLSHSDVRFLTRSAVLDTISAQLCDAALGLPNTPQRLQRNVIRNLFAVPTDNGYQSYRYHRLYRDTLLAELAMREPEAEADVCRRAAFWLDGRGDKQLAAGYALRASDTDLLARLVGEVALDAHGRGLVEQVESWLRPFDRERLLVRHPAVGVIGAWVHAAGGRAEQADRWSRSVERAGEAGPMPDDSPFVAWSAVRRAVACRRGLDGMQLDAELALSELSPFSQWRATALVALGVSHQLAGRAAQADAMLAEAAETAAAGRSTDVHALALAQRALVALDDRNIARARSFVDEGSQPAPAAQLRPSAFTPVLEAVAARVSIAQGDPVRARMHLARAQETASLLTYALPWLAVQCRLQLGLAHLALADAAEVRTLLLEIDDILHRRPQLGPLLVEVERLRQQVRGLAMGSQDGWAATLTTAELRLLPLLASHWSFREIGDQMFLSRNTIKTQAISIYRKLGVSSRTQALEKAAELGLLSEMSPLAMRTGDY
jgi:LuxR family transcriptional regulator, maltose regulon positive regulatory protein